MASEKTPGRNKRGANPLRGLLGALDSIWLGIILIAAILIYSAVGSAVPMFRQAFELTEFQYFNHWIFVTIVVLLCITLTVTTLRRIRFKLVNAGVLTVHLGLLVLCAGAMVYFGRKVEGDVWLGAPKVQILSLDRLKTDPQNAGLGSMVATEGASWRRNIPMLGGAYAFEVVDVRHKGLRTAAVVRVRVTIGDEPPTTLELRQPDGTDSGQPVASVNDRVALWLSPGNIANHFYDDATPVLLAAHEGRTEAFALPALPYYSERFAPGGETIHDTGGNSVSSRRHRPLPWLEHWKMPIRLNSTGRRVAGNWPISLEVDGYLPYAMLDRTPMPGGEEVMPIVEVSVSHEGHTHGGWLAGLIPAESMIEHTGAVSAEFRWLGDSTEIDKRWTRPVSGQHVIDVTVKDKDVHRTYDVTAGSQIAVEGTDYRITVEELRPSWPLMTPGYEQARTSIALVWVEGPHGQFQRSVLQRYPELNQDRDREGKKILEAGGLVDENISIAYTDASRHHFLIAAGQHLAPTVIHTAPGGRRSVERLETGKPFSPSDDVSLTLTNFITRPRFEGRPRVIPSRNRRPFGSVRRQQSMVRVHLRSKTGDWSRHVWVPFSFYNAEHDGTRPTVVSGVPEMGEIALVYGRMPRPLPGRMSLERLHTEFYPGRQQASEWTSYFRYEDPETGTVMRTRAFLNNTATVGPWTLYQANAAGDNESWTGLGIGNREGIGMMLAGCCLITLGMGYAFWVKPILKRRRSRIHRRDGGATRDDGDSRVLDRLETGPTSPGRRTAGAGVSAVALALTVLLGIGISPARGSEMPKAAAELAAVQVDLDGRPMQTLRTLVVQHGWRYSTMESWARDEVKTIHGSKPLYDMDSVVAALELMFNRAAYDGEPVIYVKNKAIRKELIAHPIELSETQRNRILRTGMVSRDFLYSPVVADRLRELNTDVTKTNAMNRLFRALSHYENLSSLLTIVPDPSGEADTPWLPVTVLEQDAASHLPPVDADRAREGSDAYAAWRRTWLARDASGIAAAVEKLAVLLPDLAPAGVYPSMEQRQAEVKYRRLGLIKWAWVFYIASFFVSIFAVATRYGWVRRLGLLFLAAALGLHGYDLGLRWQVIGRVPVANMYEAVVSSTWLGVLFGLILELVQKKRVFLLGSAMLGFFALSLPELLPDKIDEKLTTMMPILDDIMLRIHTVLIIGSYAVITLAFAVANCYLFVSAFRDRTTLAQGTIGAQAGAVACLVLAKLGHLDGLSGQMVVLSFFSGMLCGILMVVGLCGLILGGRPAAARLPVADDDALPRRGILEEFDLSHRVLLYTSMVTLFVGLVLGAVWADYSWGRPWGWDPKEVFALNTWMVYAILIHVRFVTRRRALWTSVLSVCGFATMQFNWWVVNFYIVGLHSYA